MSEHNITIPPADRARRATGPLGVLLALALIAPPLLFGAAAWQNYRQVVQSVETQVEATSNVLREHALRVLDTHALALEQVLDRTKGLSADQIQQSEDLHRYLAKLSRHLGSPNTLWITDAAGRTRASSVSFPAPEIDVSDREYFTRQRGKDAGVFVSVPYQARAGYLGWVFGISRRRTTPEGLFDGTVHVALQIEYFSDLWKTAGPFPTHLVPLMRDDGEMLVRYPAQVGQRLKLGPNAPFRQAIARSLDGLYTATSQVDGIERINGYRRIGNYPLTISYSVETRAALGPWWQNLFLYGGLAALGWAALIAMSVLALRRSHREAVAFAELQAETQRRQQVEARLQQSQKMEAVGQLTGGIAHDFNNLLTVIVGNAEILTESLDTPQLRSLAQMILEAGEKGADLTQHLLAFARRQTLKPERMSLDEVVRSMEPLLRRTISANIEIKTELSDRRSAALADRTLLESAILNLVVNAKDAMPQGGTLTIRTGERTAASGEGTLPIRQPVVFVTISDTGTGIPPDVFEHVFEPFFTTKEVGKGSGLGLSMVYGFAQQSGGHVSIESEVGRGTSVTIVLPAIDTQGRQTTVVDEPLVAKGAKEKILVVEDDPQVLQFVSSQLLSLGYRVGAVSSGPDALDLLHRDKSFDLLFTDVVLPKGMSGVELAGRARDVRPTIKVLLTSGYPEEAFEEHGRPDGDMPLLRKPFRRKELADALRSVLEPPTS